MKKLLLLSFLMVIATLCMNSMVHASLELRGQDLEGNNLIYDTDLDITWYDFTAIQAGHVDYQDWARKLSVTFGGTTYDDWRLPTTPDNAGSTGFNKTNSEMGHLYYTELENEAQDASLDYGPFEKLSDRVYWSGTESGPGKAWTFDFSFGEQGLDWTILSYAALAVRSGDVATSGVIPEPSSFLAWAGLLGMGLVGGWWRRRRGKQ